MKKQKPGIRSWVCLLASVVLAGCASQGGGSGFLKDYSNLSEDTQRSGARFYQNPQMYIGEYGKLFIEPLEVSVRGKKKGQELDKEELRKLKVKFYVALTDAVKDKYQVVDKPGPGVVRVRTSIANLKEKKSTKQDYSSSTLKSMIIVDGILLEAEFLDAVSSERLAAFVDNKAGQRLGFSEAINKWGDVDQAMGYWADLLVEALDKAHNKPQAPAAAPAVNASI